MCIILDASAIILLAKADILRQVCSIAKLKTTEKVKEEVMRGIKKGKKDALYLQELVREGKIKIETAEKELAEKLGKDFGLGAGESTAIALSKKQKIPIATDDNKARKTGKILGLQILSSLNFPIILCKKNTISHEKAKNALNVMKKKGWFNNALLKEAFNNLEKR